MEFEYILAILGGGLLLIGLMSYAKIHAERRARKNWATFAKRYKLKFQEGAWFTTKLRAYGLFRRKHMMAKRISEGIGNSRIQYSSYDVRLDSRWNTGVVIRKKDFTDSMNEAVGRGTAHKTENPSFNDTMFVSGTISPEIETALEVREVQDALFRLRSLYAYVCVEDGKLQVVEYNVAKQVLPMKMAFDRLCDAADILNNAVSGPTRLESESDVKNDVPIFDESCKSKTAW